MSHAAETVDSISLAREAAAGLGVAQVILRPRKAQPFFGRHPWVLDTAIDRIEGTVSNGDIVDLISDKGKFIARGFYNGHSRLRVRLYTWDAGTLLDEALFRRRLETAIALRKRLGYDNPAGAARLVYSEADGLSGLIVDRYGEYLSVQATSLAVWQRLDKIVPLLIDLVHPRGVVLRQERGAVQMEGMPHEEGRGWGDLPTGPVFIEEHDLRYGVNLREGHKTGLYLDQRENRRAVANYVQGRRMLDMFCYSGGFALNAVKHGGASEVLCVDSSEKALALARANAELNGVANLHFQPGDGFETLQELSLQKERFGIVVLDPPKFARNRAAVNDALMAYHRINRLAVNLLEPGGILVTCSCSGHVLREDFLHMLSGVAQRSNREIQVLEQRGAAPDHPISTTCLESEYLKCFVCRVG
ncbi:MAG TPA: class I SAM-dependent rRNA methyltransferase [Pirellulales bacterium]|jgi:23S rRNA (cytosine1962-C5)-methyltransferase|nr:class I SAM-dependent rRNA methyltransferase [Pirellulales bacterium]